MNTTIPFNRSPHLPISKAAETSSKPEETGKKILIVDDTVVILKVLSALLRAKGYRVLKAVDGSEAVSTIRRERPDLILLDINFPPDVAHGGGVAWDGFLIMDWLRRMDEASKTPVIIITGTSQDKTRDRCLKAGVSGYFEKPIDHQELLSTIGKILGPAESSKATTPSSPRKLVLFVDDENDWRFMASLYLKDAGFEVVAATNGSEALELMQKSKPDVVLLDLNLAGQSGLEVMKSLKSQSQDLRVVLYTGMDHDQEAIQGMLRLGAHQYLRKSTMGEMLKAVQNAVAA